jgi:hypothetical protein
VAAGLLATGAACAVPFIKTGRKRRRFTGGLVGGNAILGHRMRDGQMPVPTESVQTGIAIIGGGIAGLAAARRLNRRGRSDFVLLELEAEPGGNAASGRNEVSAYPWAAHYVPISGSDSAEVTELFEELGIITGRDATGLPVYNEEYLCADPMERLFIHGRWQEGFIPQLGNTAADQSAIDSFLAEMQRLKSVRGSDGRRAFAIPVDASSRDPEFVKWDSVSMAYYLKAKGWYDSQRLRWYVNYCCRDDYGAGIEKVSAWAGVHYFASRDGHAANAPSYAVVTWPEGNGWFVRQFRTPLGDRIRSSCAVWNLERDGIHWLTDYYDAARDKSVRLKAEKVIWAAPNFVARRVIRDLREQPAPAQPPVYSPWMVANLTLDALPRGRGMELAWDNVFYNSVSLGYVMATHQRPERIVGRTVITYYQPLDQDEPGAARRTALNRSYEQWCECIIADLTQAHPDIEEHIRHIDVWVWGHGMIRPVPDFIWSPGRAAMQPQLENLVFAHSDLSGLALFEEAYTRGVKAAERLA